LKIALLLLLGLCVRFHVGVHLCIEATSSPSCSQQTRICRLSAHTGWGLGCYLNPPVFAPANNQVQYANQIDDADAYQHSLESGQLLFVRGLLTLSAAFKTSANGHVGNVPKLRRGVPAGGLLRNMADSEFGRCVRYYHWHNPAPEARSGSIILPLATYPLLSGIYSILCKSATHYISGTDRARPPGRRDLGGFGLGR
jgi:hypothetical protein